MPIQNTGSDIKLRGDAADSVTDINEEINGNATDSDVSLGTLNTSAFTNVSDGSVVTGRAMSEMQGYSTFTSALPQTEADGALGESLLLEGNNYTFHRTPSLTSNRTTFTYSGWYKFNNLDSGNIIIMESGPTSGNGYISLRIDNANNNIYGLVGTNPGNPWLVRSPELFFDTSSWFHFVFAVDTTKDFINDRLRVYVNGIEIKFTYTANTIAKNQTFFINDGSSRICIGRTARTDQYAAYGQTVVADAKFIDGQQLRPDSFGELVQGIWIPKAFNTPSTDTLVSSNIVANYELNGNANDTSGSATTYNGTPSNVTFLNNNYGIASFNGSSASRINLGAANGFASSTLTLSFWYMPTATISGTSYKILFSNYTNSFSDGFFNISRNTDNSLEIGLYAGGGWFYRKTIPNAIKLNEWRHITFVLNNANPSLDDKVDIYVNGDTFTHNDNTNSGTPSGNFLNNSNSFYYNDWDHQTGYTDTNKTGEIQIYNSALTAAQVKQNYNATKHKYAYGLNGFWLPLNNTSIGNIDSSSNLKLHLDASNNSSYGGSGTTWSDLSGSNYHATLSGATFSSTTNNGVFTFDGSNDFASIASNSGFQSLTEFALEMWIYPLSVSDDEMINLLYTSGSNFKWDLRFSSGSSQNLRWVVGNSSGAYTSAQDLITNTTTGILPSNKWSHVTATFSSANDIMNIYINGKLTDTKTGTFTTRTNGSENLLLAKRTDGYHANIKIAQFRLYNKALTANEVVTNYRATQGNYEQVSVVDISGNANSFTSTNIDYTDHVKDQPLENYATFDPNNKINGNATITLSEGNTKVSISSGSEMIKASIGVNTGKWYWEMTGTNLRNGTIGGRFGIITASRGGQTNIEDSDFHLFWHPQGTLYRIIDGSYVTPHIATGTQYYDNDVLAIALDCDAQEIKWYKNNTLAYTYDYSSHVDSSVYLTAEAHNSSSGTPVYNFNFGQKDFTYTPPTGFKALATHNLSAPAFDPDGTTPDKPSNYFKAVTYQGNGGMQGEAYGYKEGSRAAVFNGSSSYIQVGNPIPNTDTDVAISAWVNLNSGISSHMHITGTGITSAGSEAPFRATLQYQSANTFRIFSLRQVAGTYYLSPNSSLTNVTINPNTWYHIIWSYTASGRLLNTFLNGVQIDTNVSMTTSGSSVNDSTTVIGSFRSTSGPFFNGKLDQVRMFNKALSSTEVGYLADDDTTNINAISNLVAHYDMEGNANDTSGSATTYNGTASNVTYTQDKPYGNIDVGFKPDLVWIKKRGPSTSNHLLQNTIQGAGTGSALSSNSTGAAGNFDQYGYISAFDTNGFTLQGGTSGSYPHDNANENNSTYVAWAWKAAGFKNDFNVIENGTLTTSDSNATAGITAGSITNGWNVSANRDAGFSIVKYTGTGANATVGHGLSSAPELIITKGLSTTYNWNVVTSLVPNGYLELNTTSNFNSNSSRYITAGNTTNSLTDYVQFNQNNISHIQYNFHSVDGFSKIGSYYGNSSADGPFIYTGFKPAWIMVKKVSGTSYSNSDRWFIWDNTREEYNKSGDNQSNVLCADDSAAENGIKRYTTQFYSNGFKLAQYTEGHNHTSSNHFIYMAFAEDPVKYSNGVATLGDGNEFIQGGNYPEDNFSATTYTGNGSTQDLDFGFKPDLVWIKNRSNANPHSIQDTVTGDFYLRSNATDTAAATSGNNVSSFNQNGITVKDSSSGAYNVNGAVGGTYSGNAQHVAWSWKAAGHEYKSAALNGSSSKIDLSNLGLGGAATRTISAWINVNSLSANRTIFQYGNSAANNRFGFAIEATTGKLYVEYYGRDAITSSSQITVGSWFHVVATYNGGAIETATNTQIYVNGSAVSMSTTGTETGVANTTDSNYGIGYRRASSTQYFNGKIDQVRIFDKALSSSEVTTLYNETKNTVNTLQVLGDTSCIATYRLNGDAIDLSGNYNGTESNIDYATGSHFAYNIYENKARTFSHKASTLSLDTGTITPTDINANRDNGFSIVKYTGNNGASGTIGHGLSSPPELIITKALNFGAGWPTQFNAGGTAYYGLRLNTSGGNDAANGGVFYNNTAPTSTVYTVGGSDETNDNYNYISYCWHSVPGFSKIGLYTGNNGSAKSIDVGFEPAWIMIKNTASGYSWIVIDNKRGTGLILYMNLTNQDTSTSTHITSFNSNGFTVGSNADVNYSTNTYLYLAFAHR